MVEASESIIRKHKLSNWGGGKGLQTAKRLKDENYG